MYRIIRQALLDFIRLPWLSLASTLMMALTLLVIAAFILLHGVLQKTAGELRDKVEVTVFLKDEASEEAIGTLIAELRTRSDVKAVNYIDKKTALELFRARFKDRPEFLDFISEERNPLPRSLVIKTVSPEDIGNVARFLEQEEQGSIKRLPFADTQLFVDRLNTLAKFLSWLGIVASAAFIVVSILIIFNAIYLTVSNRSSEIEIMRLVGATKLYIRTPFLLLGSLYGLLGALVASGLLFFIGRLLGPVASRYLSGFTFDPLDYIVIRTPQVILTIALIGVLLGGFVSALAVRRVLRR